MLDAWASVGGEASGFGYPLTDQFCGLAGGGCGQHFQGSSLYWSPATQTQSVQGVFLDQWRAIGAETGPLGYPRSGARRYVDGHEEQEFEHGLIWWTAEYGTTVRLAG
jgi:uncharacterized protein with LGFP repeats